MADSRQTNQQATRQQDQQPEAIDLHVISLNKIKELGEYTPEEITDLYLLFKRLQEIHNSDGLIEKSDVRWVRLANRGTPQDLTATTTFFGSVPKQERGSTLFYADYISFLTSMAWYLHQLRAQGMLRFVQSADPLQLVRLWGDEAGSGYVSEISLWNNRNKVAALISALETAFIELNPSLVEASQEEAKPEFSKEKTHEDKRVLRNDALNAAALAQAAAEATTAQQEAEAAQSAEQPQSVREFFTEHRPDIQNLQAWLFAYGTEELLNQYLNETLMTSYLEDQRGQTLTLLREQLYDYLITLPPEKLNALFDLRGKNVGTDRLKLWLEFERHLQAQSAFTKQLEATLHDYIDHLEEINAYEELEDLFEKLEEDETPIISKAVITTWKKEVATSKRIKSLPAEEPIPEQPAQPKDKQEEEAQPETAPSRVEELASITAVGVTLENQLAQTQLTELQKDQIRAGYNKAVAELFNDFFVQHAIEYAAVPANLHSQLAAAEEALRQHIIESVSSLQTSALLSFTTQQGSLLFVTSIKNDITNSGAQQFFTKFYSAFAQTLPQEKQQAFAQSVDSFLSGATTISVADDIARKIENTRRYAQDYFAARAGYELVEIHGVDTNQLSNDLQSDFRDIKSELSDSAKRFSQLLTPSELELFATKPEERARLLTQFYTLLNSNTKFRSTLTQFYSRYESFLISEGRTHDHELFQQSLDQTLTRVGASYILNDVDALSAEQLFRTALKTQFDISDHLLTDNVQNTIDALLLSYGIDPSSASAKDAAWFIRNLSRDRMALIFGLPKNIVLNDTQAQKLRELFADYAELRFAQLPEHVGGELLTHGISGLDPELLQEHVDETAFTGHIAREVTPIREAIKDGQTAEELAKEAHTDAKPGMQQANKAVLNVFLESWTIIPIEEQKLIYEYYGKPYPKQYQSATVDPNINLPFPIEFLDFKRRDFEKFVQLSKERHADLSKQRERENLRALAELSDTQQAIIQQEITERRRARQLMLEYARQMEKERSAHLQEIARLYELESTAQLMAALEQEERENQAINELRYADMLAMDAALSENPEAFAGQSYRDVQTGSLLGKYKSLQSRRRALQSFSSLARRKAGASVAGKAATSAAGRLAGMATGVGTAAVLAMEALRNKRVREALVGVSSYALITTINALSSVGGLILGIVGGLTAGPLGFIAGAHAGNALIPVKWTNWLGMNSRTPPSIGDFFGSSESFAETGNVSPLRPSLRELRGEEIAARQTPQGVASDAAGRPIDTNLIPENATSMGPNNPLPPPQSPSPVALNTTGSSLPSLASQVSSLSIFTSIGTSAPLMAITVGIVMTHVVMTIIAGAFFINVPTRSNNWKDPGFTQQDQYSQYVELTKTASPTRFENNTTTPVNYSITINPKASYNIQITSITDEFSYQGGDALSLSSPLTNSFFPNTPFNDTQQTSYTLEMSGEDVMVINTLTIIFDVYDSSGNQISSNERLLAIAAVTIGEPDVGCFIFGAGGKRFDYSGGSAVSQNWTVAEQQKMIQAYVRHVGSNPRFTSLVCANGPVTLYRLGSSNWYGWTMSNSEIGFYSGTFSSNLATELTLIHELGHIIDFRNAGLRQQFVQLLPPDLHGCYTYPSAARCRTAGTGDIEVFAEGVMQYVLNYQNYNLKTKHPQEYQWFKTNIYGGVEYY